MNRKFYVLHDVKCRVVVKIKKKKMISQLEDCRSKFPETDSFKVQQSEAVT